MPTAQITHISTGGGQQGPWKVTTEFLDEGKLSCKLLAFSPAPGVGRAHRMPK
jgi:hypothetical protein